MHLRHLSKIEYWVFCICSVAVAVTMIAVTRNDNGVHRLALLHIIDVGVHLDLHQETATTKAVAMLIVWTTVCTLQQ